MHPSLRASEAETETETEPNTSAAVAFDLEKGLKSQLELWALPPGPGVRADYYRNGPKAPSSISPISSSIL